MRKFKFTLQSVHNVRELREEKEQTVFARLSKDASEAEERLFEVSRKILSAMNSYTHSMRGGTALDPVVLDLHSKHIAALERLKQRIIAEVEQKKSACREQAKRLSNAARDVKVTAKLREKQKAVHDLEAAKSEQNTLDEITSAKHARLAGETNG
ncbi:MAG: flagellar export protein FliJ [Pyrinomonadaceae bacterium]